MKTVATIEARMGSSRLPGKVMLPILGRPTLELLIERLRRCRTLDGIVVATTDHPADAVIERTARRAGVACFRGSEQDVLDRVLRAAASVDAELIVEITGDCPLIDPAMVDATVEFYRTNEFDYVSNSLRRPLPLGLGVQVFRTALLEAVAAATQDPADREHVTLHIYEHPERFRIGTLVVPEAEQHSDLRLTLDTADDFALIAEIYESLYPVKPDFSFHDIAELCGRRPELAKINQHIEQKRARG